MQNSGSARHRLAGRRGPVGLQQPFLRGLPDPAGLQQPFLRGLPDPSGLQQPFLRGLPDPSGLFPVLSAATVSLMTRRSPCLTFTISAVTVAGQIEARRAVAPGSLSTTTTTRCDGRQENWPAAGDSQDTRLLQYNPSTPSTSTTTLFLTSACTAKQAFGS